MGDVNPIRTLGDYFKPSHEGYRNTIELPKGNNVVPLRPDTIRLERMRLHLFQFSLRDQASNWLERLPAGSITTWEELTTRFLAQFFLSGRTAKLRNDILIWNDSKDFVKPVKAISTSQGNSKTPDRRLLELEDQINFLLKGPRPTSRPSSTHVPQAYLEEVSSTPHLRNQSERPKQNPFNFRERTGPYPQPQALETTPESRERDYMAAQAERIDRFENAIFKQCEVINDRMTEMFGLLKELSASRTPEKVLIREEARHPIIKGVNFIFVIRVEEEKME
uniref:Retrotransposon gag domain-containing protein n=1 Tax=Tanacetum cinerariifolium TaxID=118510 RepID=A0A6L2LH61_TANCI|nr:hypothetical protein [Tanacetum cinerariifolium]